MTAKRRMRARIGEEIWAIMVGVEAAWREESEQG